MDEAVGTIDPEANDPESGDSATGERRTSDPRADGGPSADDGPSADTGDVGGEREGPSPRELIGAVLLAAIPATLVAVPALILSWFVDVSAAIVLPVSVIVGLVGSYAIGPTVVDRSISRMDPINGNRSDHLRERVTDVARSNGITVPTVRVVQRSAVTVGVAATREKAMLVVPARLVELDDRTFEAMVLHALSRADSHNARLTTAFLPAMLLVEAVQLFGDTLVSHRPSSDSDRPRAFGADKDGSRSVPWAAYALAGGTLLVAIAPWWLLLTAGDRLLVGGGRMSADRAVARLGRADALAEALEYGRDASGHRGWAFEIDRLAVVPMGEMASRRARGTSRGELRIRIARLRSKRPA
ncbi:hypothetical protein ACERIT_12620 [Halopenitus sp. H-Gu1]|uniref:hypothetical protein n=1 Tax=Halopenitus sp. H-Gu1 TaxID=3242697 RepID=UPI00359E23DF